MRAGNRHDQDESIGGGAVGFIALRDGLIQQVVRDTVLLRLSTPWTCKIFLAQSMPTVVS